jgi:hypothetical protein
VCPISSPMPVVPLGPLVCDYFQIHEVSGPS